MLKVKKDPQNNKLFWIYNPIGDRGRWCTLGFNGKLNDTKDSMFLKTSPESYQKAYKSYIQRHKNDRNGTIEGICRRV